MEGNSKPTQVERVREYMKRNGSITQYEAMTELGVMRLASRISEMRNKEMIIRDTVEVTNRFGEKCRAARYRFIEV